jgi:5-methylthioadenosine/S-adenosylhomocysteine deaminase
MLLSAKYVIPITSSYIEDGAVLVREDRIEDVGPAAFLKAKYPDEEIRDMGLSALMPGFVDVHTHMGYTALRGMFGDLPYSEWKRQVLYCEPFFSEEDWTNSARLGALEAIASGITTVADISGSGCSRIAAADLGMRARIYLEVLTTQADHVDAVVEEGLSKISAWQQDEKTGLVDYGLAPGAVYACHPKVFQAIAKAAIEKKIPIAMHLAGSQEETDFIRYGSSPFGVHVSEHEHGKITAAYPPWLPAGTSPVKYVSNWDILDVPDILAIHCVHVDDEDIEILKAKDVRVGYCPRINAKLGMGSAPLESLWAAGLTIGMGTDSPAAVDTTDMIDEMRIGLMITRATSSVRFLHASSANALRMATIGSARALGIEDKVGSLEVGKQADIIAVDLHNSHQNPTTNPESAVIYTANQDNVKMTMVAGRVLYDNFTHVSGCDRDKIVETARELRSRIRDAAGNDSLRQTLLDSASDDKRDRYNR